MSKQSCVLSGGSLIVLAICSSAAWSQSPAGTGGQATPSALTPQPEVNPASGPPEIIVTATRRQTTLEKTPLAVSAFSQEQLDRQQVANVTDIQRFVPSLQFNQNAANNALLVTLRGIGNDAAFTISSDPEVGFYVDGIYAPTVQGSSLLLYDLERLEVLRGPQGTLFGRNTTAGAITLTTAKPDLSKESGYIELIGGDDARFGSRGAFNLPVSSTLAVRLSFATEQHDGYVSYQQPPTLAGVDSSAYDTKGKRYNSQDQQSARLSLAWKPSSRFTWNINVEGFLDNGTPDIPLMQIPRTGEKTYSALVDTSPKKSDYDFSVRSTMNYQISDYIDASYIAGYSRDHSTDTDESDAGALPALDPTGNLTPYGSERIQDRKDSSYVSQELQFRSSGHHLIDWIVGGLYSNEQATGRQDIDDRNGNANGPEAFAISFLGGNYRVNSFAGYGQATLNLNSKLRLTGGLRYSVDKKSEPDEGTVTLAAGCPAAVQAGTPACTGIEGQYFSVNDGAKLASLLGPEFVYTPSNIVPRTFSKLTYLARAEFDITPNIMAYAGVSTGFKSGIVNPTGPITGPETLTDYEGGLKMRLLDRRLTLNLSAYYYDYKGFQVSEIVVQRDAAGNPVGSTLQTVNAKGATAYGFEAEAVGDITRLDRVQVALALQHTRIGSLVTLDQIFDSDPTDASAQRQLEGNKLPHAPTFSLTVTYEHDFKLANGGTITPRGTMHFETGSWLSIFNGDRTNRYINGQLVDFGTAFDRQSAYTRSDFAIRYTAPSDKYEVEGFVQNVEDAKVRTNAQNYNTGTIQSQGIFLSYLQPPRTFGGRVKFKF